jgi:superfamily I DNA/RNA helicase
MNKFEITTWNEKQIEVLSSEPNVLIIGSAGTGKTILALKKAIDLKNENKSVAFIVFTKALKTFLIDKFQIQNTESSLIINYEYEWQQSKKQFDYIIIDEFQDFSFDTLNKFAEYASLGVYYFGDLEQQLYSKNLQGEKTITKDQLKKLKINKIINLTENFRIPNEIVRLANNIYYIKNDKKSLNINKNTSSFIPQIHSFINHKEELEYIVNFIQGNHKHKSIGILLNRNEPSNYTSGGIFFDTNYEAIPSIIELRNYLERELKLEIGYKFKGDNQLDFTSDSNINILTIHSSKGLEFDIVILPFSRMLNEFIHENQLYVALTRSKEKVIITYSGQVQREYVGINNTLIKGELKTTLK